MTNRKVRNSYKLLVLHRALLLKKTDVSLVPLHLVLNVFFVIGEHFATYIYLHVALIWFSH